MYPTYFNKPGVDLAKYVNSNDGGPNISLIDIKQLLVTNDSGLQSKPATSRTL